MNTNWKKRFDEYFYDSDHSLTPRQVEHIKTALVAPLLTERTEAVIADIPDEASVMTRDDIENGTDLLWIKQELRRKWLNEEKSIIL